MQVTSRVRQSKPAQPRGRPLRLRLHRLLTTSPLRIFDDGGIAAGVGARGPLALRFGTRRAKEGAAGIFGLQRPQFLESQNPFHDCSPAQGCRHTGAPAWGWALSASDRTGWFVTLRCMTATKGTTWMRRFAQNAS